VAAFSDARHEAASYQAHGESLTEWLDAEVPGYRSGIAVGGWWRSGRNPVITVSLWQAVRRVELRRPARTTAGACYGFGPGRTLASWRFRTRWQ
jgi:hypothetical protein